MQSFSRDLAPIDDGNPRTTAVAAHDFLGGVGGGQVPRLTSPSLKQPPPTPMGRKLTFGALIQSPESSHHHDRVPFRTLLGGLGVRVT
jgi:hypothetical protein